MVEFVSLLTALLIGSIEIELAVQGEVAAVVLELDGAEVGRLTGPPWRQPVDLGEQLRPHRLSAIALDAEGGEVHRATRHFNVYRPPSGVEYVLHRNSSGWLTMIGLTWPERGDAKPGRFAVSVNGKPVEADDRLRIWLPPLDPAMFQVIETVVEYSDGLVAVDRIGFGGEVLGSDSARVTPFVVETGTAAMTELVGRSFEVSGSARVVGVERGEAEIVFVRDVEAARAVAAFGPSRGVAGALAGARDAQAARLIHAAPFEADEWARLIDTSAVDDLEQRFDLTRLRAPLISDQEGRFGLFWNLKQYDTESATGAAWIADGLALAAVRVAAAPRRQAVVLVLAPRSADEGSRLEPHQALDYLAAQGLSFETWYLGKAEKAPPDWGGAIGVRGLGGIEDALEGLRSRLERQRLVWVEGVHLPGELEINVR